MSRIILAMYEGTDEPHIVVGWDRPCASFFWQEFNKEPEGDPDTKWESPEAEGWQEMKRYGGYGVNELPTLESLMVNLPPDLRTLVDEYVVRLLREHSMDPEAGRIVVNLSDGHKSPPAA